MYEDSIQELNNLIGELDSFQREHEQKMKQKQHDKQQQQHSNDGHDMHSTTGDTTMTASSIGDTSDIYNNFDNLSISSSDRNALMGSTATNAHNDTHSSEMTFGCDAVDGLSDLTDCQATTMTLKLNLSTTEHPLVMQHNRSSRSRGTSSNNYNGVNTLVASPSGSKASNGSTEMVHSIELIPDSYNVTDDFVKEHSTIVVLRRKDSQDGGANERTSSNRANADVGGVERISSFRCSSFAKADSNGTNDVTSTLRRGQSMASADSVAFTAAAAASNRFKTNEHTNDNNTPVMRQFDPDPVDRVNDDESNSAALQMFRQKPIITPRPASLSGLFVLFLFSSFLVLFFLQIIFYFSICVLFHNIKFNYLFFFVYRFIFHFLLHII